MTTNSTSPKDEQEKPKTAEEIYEKNRPRFHDWGTLKQMCLASMQEYADQEVARSRKLDKGREHIKSIPMGNSADPEIATHLEGIKFLKGYCGHSKVFIECHPADPAAIQLGDIWINELDIKAGADLHFRMEKFKIRDWLYNQNIGTTFIDKFMGWLLGPKP